MDSLITYLNQKAKEFGRKPTMPELRAIIKSDSSEYERITEDLQILYRKTFQYEEMQKVLTKSPQLN